jgi:hypothetical protein
VPSLPPYATNGVGSLPHADPVAAVRHVLRAYELPFCPQLPRVDGDMIAEWLGADPGHCGWALDRDRERPAAWDDFVARLTADPPSHGLVKLQVTGPVTLAIALERGAGQRGHGPRVVSLAREIATWLAANSAGQVRRLAGLGLDALVVVDEPGLARAGLSRTDGALWDPLRAVAPVWGMHICGPVPWYLVDALELDLLSLDVATHGVPPDGAGALARMLGRQGHIALGILDHVQPTPSANAGATAVAALSALADERVSLARVADQSLLTPSCGTGRLSPERERLVATSLDAAARAARGALAAAPTREATLGA